MLRKASVGQATSQSLDESFKRLGSRLSLDNINKYFTPHFDFFTTLFLFSPLLNPFFPLNPLISPVLHPFLYFRPFFAKKLFHDGLQQTIC